MTPKQEIQQLNRDSQYIREQTAELVSELEGMSMNMIETKAKELAESLGLHWEEMSGFDKQTYMDEFTCKRCESLKDEACGCRDPQCPSI